MKSRLWSVIRMLTAQAASASSSSRQSSAGSQDGKSSSSIGVSCMSVSPSGVSTGRTSLPCVGAEAPTLAEARVRTGGGEEGAGGAHDTGMERKP